MNIRTRTATVFQLDFERLTKYTKFPYGLVIPQSMTERVLEDRLVSLGGRVYRPHTVVGMSTDRDDNSLVAVSFQDGQTIKAKYVVGADGARSTVRSLYSLVASCTNLSS